MFSNTGSCPHLTGVVELFTMLTGSKEKSLFSKINHTHHQLTKLIIILARGQTPSCLSFHLKSLASGLVPWVKQQSDALEISRLLSRSMIQ